MLAVRQASLPGFDLGDYIKESIDFLRQHEPPEGYFVGFSGGKDSITTLELCRLAGVKHQAFYSCTRIDPPEVVRFIKRKYPAVTWLFPAASFWNGIVEQCPPLITNRWCCDALKKKPSKSNPLKKRIMGIRAEESIPRAKRPRIDKFHYKPIFKWPEWAVWEFIEACKLPYPSLYDEGFHRIGCVVCPYLLGTSPGKTHQRAMRMTRWPGMWKAFEHVVKRWWKATSAKGQRLKSYEGETADDYWQAYLNGFENKDTAMPELVEKPGPKLKTRDRDFEAGMDAARAIWLSKPISNTGQRHQRLS